MTKSMQRKIAIYLLLLSSSFITQAAEEDVSSDFLDFIIEIEEGAQDGFVSWLEDDSEDNE